MRALITGSTGFIGRNLCERLQKMAIEYDTVGRNWRKTLTGKGEYDLVFYLAGEVRNPERMYEANVALLYRALACSLNWNCIFVYVGSSSEYGRMPRAMREKDPINPTNLYEATKGMGTLLCQGFARQFNVPVVIVRPSSVYGKYERPEKLIPTIIRKIKENKPIDIYPGVHDWIYVDDFLDGIFTVLLKGNYNGDIYNISSGCQHSNLEIAEIIRMYCASSVAINKNSNAIRDYDTDHWIVDNSKIKALGWFPKYEIKSGLQKTVRGILEE